MSEPSERVSEANEPVSGERRLSGLRSGGGEPPGASRGSDEGRQADSESRHTAGSTDYLATHLEEALAEDVRVAEQGLRVQVAGAHVVVSGTVSDPQRQEAVAEVLGEMVGERALVDLTEVAGSGPPPEEQV